jgi:hypothetical protein
MIFPLKPPFSYGSPMDFPIIPEIFPPHRPAARSRAANCGPLGKPSKKARRADRLDAAVEETLAGWIQAPVTCGKA